MNDLINKAMGKTKPQAMATKPATNECSYTAKASKPKQQKCKHNPSFQNGVKMAPDFAALVQRPNQISDNEAVMEADAPVAAIPTNDIAATQKLAAS